MVERKDPNRFVGLTDGFDPEKFADDDFRIRSGLCPNCPDTLLDQDGHGSQRCANCGFWTNCRAERENDN